MKSQKPKPRSETEADESALERELEESGAVGMFVAGVIIGAAAGAAATLLLRDRGAEDDDAPDDVEPESVAGDDLVVEDEPAPELPDGRPLPN